MSAAREARDHLAKAARYLRAAELSLDEGLFDPAVLSAVACGTHCKDAVCLAVLGTSRRSEAHGHETRELKKAGPQGEAMAPHMSRLIGLKPRAQYAHDSVSRAVAESAVKTA